MCECQKNQTDLSLLETVLTDTRIRRSISSWFSAEKRSMPTR